MPRLVRKDQVLARNLSPPRQARESGNLLVSQRPSGLEQVPVGSKDYLPCEHWAQERPTELWTSLDFQSRLPLTYHGTAVSVRGPASAGKHGRQRPSPLRVTVSDELGRCALNMCKKIMRLAEE